MRRFFVREADSNESPYAGHKETCKKCQDSTCFALHDYSAKECPFPATCDECAELETLDSQISEVHALLASLSLKRRELKGRINYRHDTLIEHLPIEVVSMIFRLVTLESDGPRYVKSNYCYPWVPVLLLGAVCKSWREITLASPELWANVTIDPWKHALLPDLTTQWLSRSGAHPLSLTVKGINASYISSEPSFPAALANLMQTLRNSACRWKELHLNVSSRIAYDLLNGLDDTPHLDALHLNDVQFLFEIDQVGRISMKNEITPKYLFAKRTNLDMFPLRWDKLSHLIADSIGLDTLLHIFRHATKLQICQVNANKKSQDLYPLPRTPILSNLKTLDTEAWRTEVDILRYLTLPTLETLTYSLPTRADRAVLPILADFIERSKPHLKTFMFDSDVFNVEDSNDWYQMFPTVTHLNCDIDLAAPQLPRLEEYIRGLGAHMKPLAFPNLQALSFRVLETTPECWSLLGKIFPDPSVDPPMDIVRPLKLLQVYLTSQNGQTDLMDERSRDRLYQIQQSGVDVGAFDDNDFDLLRFGKTTIANNEGDWLE